MPAVYDVVHQGVGNEVDFVSAHDNAHSFFQKHIMQSIQDYQQTQALQLNADEVAIARAVTQAVMTNGQVHIEPEVLKHDALPEYFFEKEVILKQIFMTIDSAFDRQAVQSATLYAWLPENNDTPAMQGTLVRLVQLGQPIENRLNVDEETVKHHLAARTARSGWANIAQDIAHWLHMEALHGEHNRRAAVQASLPVCGEDGVVYGVMHLESQNTLSEQQLAVWVGLVLGILPAMRELLSHVMTDGCSSQVGLP